MSGAGVHMTSVFVVDDHEMVADSLLLALDSAPDLRAVGRATTVEQISKPVLAMPSEHATGPMATPSEPVGPWADARAPLKRSSGSAVVMTTRHARPALLVEDRFRTAICAWGPPSRRQRGPGPSVVSGDAAPLPAGGVL